MHFGGHLDFHGHFAHMVFLCTITLLGIMSKKKIGTTIFLQLYMGMININTFATAGLIIRHTNRTMESKHESRS